MQVDLEIAMSPTTAAELPYRSPRVSLRRLLRRLVGRPAPHRAAGTSGGRREVGPAIARGPVAPHSGRGGVVIDLRDASHDPLPERERMLVRPAREWRAQGRAAAVGLHVSKTSTARH